MYVGLVTAMTFLLVLLFKYGVRVMVICSVLVVLFKYGVRVMVICVLVLL